MMSESKEQQVSRMNVVVLWHPLLPESWPSSIHSSTWASSLLAGQEVSNRSGPEQAMFTQHFSACQSAVNFGTLVHHSNTVIINGDWCAFPPHTKYLWRYFLLWKIYIKPVSLTILSVWFSGFRYIYNIVQPSHLSISRTFLLFQTELKLLSVSMNLPILWPSISEAT